MRYFFTLAEVELLTAGITFSSPTNTNLFTRADTYTAQATVGDVNKGITTHKNLESDATATLLVFGNGDGGGGALPKMLENLCRIRATTSEHRELPSVSMGSSVEEFFADIEETSKEGKTLPVWSVKPPILITFLTCHARADSSSEAQRQFHRGIYSSHGSIKRATLTSLLKPKGHPYVYPKRAIDECWEKVLLNQCFWQSMMSYLDLQYKLYAKVCEVPLSRNATHMKAQVIQTSADGKHGYALMHSVGNKVASQPVGMSSICMPASVFMNGMDHFVFRNANLQFTISEGRISGLIDVRLGLTLGVADVEIHHLETATLLSFSQVRVIAEGPLFRRRLSTGAVQLMSQSLLMPSLVRNSANAETITYRWGVATMKGNSRSGFNFDAVVDWHERHKFLKFELPLNINNMYATYESQFGFVQWLTHKNTTLDAAKFEVCGHKLRGLSMNYQFADLSEYGYGVAFLSESQYGFACEGNVLRIFLLRVATAPDAEQDQGRHEFSWAVMPHIGSFLESDVPMAALILCTPSPSSRKEQWVLQSPNASSMLVAQSTPTLTAAPPQTTLDAGMINPLSTLISCSTWILSIVPPGEALTFASEELLEEFAALAQYGLKVSLLKGAGAGIGDASSLKLCESKAKVELILVLVTDDEGRLYRPLHDDDAKCRDIENRCGAGIGVAGGVEVGVRLISDSVDGPTSFIRVAFVGKITFVYTTGTHHIREPVDKETTVIDAHILVRGLEKAHKLLEFTLEGKVEH
ncbi:galactose mutarotase-like domain-containing protein [Suillus occidentalis]|nr:galactose mutarotase-like domain-containing protein [Suillus occidentalis]